MIFPTGVKALEGNELAPMQVRDAPAVTYPAEPRSYYTLLFTDPDAPSRDKADLREVRHWAVVNIPGNDVSAGETLVEYVGSGPPEGTGLHRYVFLVFKQPGKLTFDETYVSDTYVSDTSCLYIRKSTGIYSILHHLIEILTAG